MAHCGKCGAGFLVEVHICGIIVTVLIQTEGDDLCVKPCGELLVMIDLTVYDDGTIFFGVGSKLNE